MSKIKKTVNKHKRAIGRTANNGAQRVRHGQNQPASSSQAASIAIKLVSEHLITSGLLNKPTKLAHLSKSPTSAKPKHTATVTRVADKQSPSWARQGWQKKLVSKLAGHVRSEAFARQVAIFGSLILLITTLFWSILSAKIHSANADQLIDAYLFKNSQTFNGATFPGTHTFLLKWPIFGLMQLFGTTNLTFLVVTVIMVMATIGILAYVMFHIVRNQLLFGIICLALASVLLLIPAQPYPGALLPVNMAMTTTRNLEYIVFIGMVMYGSRLRRVRLRSGLFIVALSALLVGSDKLFGVMAAGGAVLATIYYLVYYRSKHEYVRSLQLLLLILVGIFAAAAVLFAINAAHITNIFNEQAASPFPLIHSPKQLALGVIYGSLAVFTNMGANPVHATIVVGNLLSDGLHSFRSISIIAYVVNGLALIGCLYAVYKVLTARQTDFMSRSVVFLVASSLVVIGIFIGTDHYYPVDARYLTIELFALCIAAATYLRGRQIRLSYSLAAVIVLSLTLPISLVTNWREYQRGEVAMAGNRTTTALVADQLERHKIQRLVGDYWQITPVKPLLKTALTIAPVTQCTMPRQVLNSTAWFKRPFAEPTAYLAVKDPLIISKDTPSTASSSATYNGCSIARVVREYGVPSERIVIKAADKVASTASPEQNASDVLLLLYANGPQPADPARQIATRAKKALPPAAPKAVEPQSFVPFTEKDPCSRGTTLQVVAHQDDDILFMNPDVLNSIKDGRCIRTVYLTAGDAGENIGYWGGREKGAQAAYAQMFNVAYVWHSEPQMLEGKPVTVSYLEGLSQISLVFMRLPDGNLRGEGFVGDGYQSLSRLVDGVIPNIQVVDKSASYTKPELTAALLSIMTLDLPDQIRTLGSGNINDGDHADHHSSGILTADAAAAYRQPHTITRYIGYPDKQLVVNLSDDEITNKQISFIAYAKFDGAVCQTAFECQTTYTYGSYLTRKYIRSGDPISSP